MEKQLMESEVYELQLEISKSCLDAHSKGTANNQLLGFLECNEYEILERIIIKIRKALINKDRKLS